MSDIHQQILAEFSFLANDHGFTLAIAGDSMVVFTGSKSIIRVGVGRRGEVGITFDRPTEDHFYPFEFYLRALHPQESYARLDCEAWSKLELAINLKNLAAALVRYGGDVIRGDPVMFSEIQLAAAKQLES